MAQLRDPNSKIPNVDRFRNVKIKGPVVDTKKRDEYIQRALAARMQTSDTKVTELLLPDEVDAKNDKAIQEYVSILNKRNKNENISYSYDKEKGKVIKTEKAAEGEKFQSEITDLLQLPLEEQIAILKAATEDATITDAEAIIKYREKQEEEKKKYLGLSERSYSLLANIFKASGKNEAQIRKDIEYIVSKPNGIEKRLTALLGGHLGVNKRARDTFKRKAKKIDKQYQLTREDDNKV